MTCRHRAIVWQPAHFGRIEEGGNTELVVEARVVSVLVVNVDFEPLDLLSDRLEVSTFQKVIKTSHQKDPHRAGLSVVVKSPGKQQVSNGCPWNGQPVDM